MSSTEHPAPDQTPPRVFTEDEVERALKSTLTALEFNPDYRSLGVHDRDSMRGMFASACRIVLREGGEEMLKRAYTQQVKMTDRLSPARKESNLLAIAATRHFAGILGIALPDASQQELYTSPIITPQLKPHQSRLLELVHDFSPEQYRMDLERRMATGVGQHGRIVFEDTNLSSTDPVRISKNIRQAIETFDRKLRAMDVPDRSALRQQLATLVDEKCNEWEIERNQNLFGFDDYYGVASEELKAWSQHIFDTIDHEQAQTCDNMKRAIAEIVQPARSGRQVAPGQRVDPAMAGRIALTLQSAANGFERGDTLEHFTQNTLYTSSNGAARTLLNQTLRRFCEHMDMPCPELHAHASSHQR